LSITAGNHTTVLKAGVSSAILLPKANLSISVLLQNHDQSNQSSQSIFFHLRTTPIPSEF
jgi:hypothetical protein